MALGQAARLYHISSDLTHLNSRGLCLKKNWTPAIFWHKLIKSSLI